MIYLDNAATTKPLKEALSFAEKHNYDEFFNPSALYHGGLNNKKEINITKNIILNALSTSYHEVIFTSCGSESDNQAIFCKTHHGAIVTTSGEHSAIYKSALAQKNNGATVYFAKLNKDGGVDENDLLDYIKNNQVSLVSIVHVNNETGAINDINKLAKEIKSINKDILFHSDGVQAFMKIPYAISQDIDLYSISAHKINALKGTGVLIKKKNVSISPLIYGGGQENGYRSGTENIFGIKVLEYCVNEKSEHFTDYFNRVYATHNAFLANLDLSLFEIISTSKGSPYIFSLSAKGVKGEVIMHMLEEFDIIVGNGSACSSKSRYSRVIEACGYKNNDGIIRISFSPYLSENDVVFAAQKLNEVTSKLQKIMHR